MTSVSADVFVSPTAAGVSELTLWSINARLIGRVFCHSRMMCVAFSNAPEGISVNAVAAVVSGWYHKVSREGIMRMKLLFDVCNLLSTSCANTHCYQLLYLPRSV